MIGRFDLVPRGEGSTELQENPGNEVLEHVLDREGHGDAEDSERTENRADGDTQRVEPVDQAHQPDHVADEPADQLGDEAIGLPPLQHAREDDADDAADHERPDHDSRAR